MKSLRRIEFVAAILLTVVLVFFHFSFFFHAGALWRDEISSLSLATKSTLSQFWKSLPLDPFPVSYFILLRLWNGIGLGGNDFMLRVLGLLIGLVLLAAIWLSSYMIDKSPPLWPLALFAFSPLVLETGDSLRPYGFGLIWLLLAFALFYRIAFGEVNKRLALAALVVALLSVQSVFTNAFMLLAIGLGAIFVLLKKKEWRKIALIASIGLICALTVLPYLSIMRATAEWSVIIPGNNSFGYILAVARDAIADAGLVSYWIWLILSVLLLVSFGVALWPRLSAILDLRREQMLLGGVTFLTAGAVIIGFLCVAHYLVFPRYFLPVICIAGFCMHVFWNAFPRRATVRIVGLVVVLVTTASALSRLSQRAQTRMTNCDQIAAAVEQRVTGDDLIIVSSFLYGVTFQRYYHGTANWLAVPQLDDFTLHRWDLLKETMARPDPMPELLSRAETVLRSGHKIFLVGKLGPADAEQPESLPPAPQTEFGWQMEPYLAQWKAELAYWIEHHAIHGSRIAIGNSEPINELEFLGAFEVSGWRESSP